MASFFSRLGDYLRMIKVSHTLFALPFALVAVVFIWRHDLAMISWLRLFYIVGAFTALRSFSMAVNRLVDARLDAKNPRTASREIPAGKISSGQVRVFAMASLLFVLIFALLLSQLAFFLSPFLLLILGGYSYAKRFTWLCHLWLGLAIGLAPIGVYIALTSTIPATAWVLFFILTTYITGFDILYAIQDIDFDRKERLYSIPARFGVNAALIISTVFHLLTLFGFYLLSLVEPLGLIYGIGALVLAALVIGEHLVVGWGKNVKKERIPMAFFHFNSAISLLFLAVVYVDNLLAILACGGAG